MINYGRLRVGLLRVDSRGDFQIDEKPGTFLVMDEIGLFEFGVEYPFSNDRHLENNTHAVFLERVID